jgi:hypothetical protein
VLTLLICLTGFLTFYLLGTLVVYSFFGYDGIQLMQNLAPDNPRALSIIKILQISQSVGFFIIPSVILAFLFSEKPSVYLGFKKTSASILFYSVALVFIALPAINLLGSLNMLIHLPDGIMRLEQKAMELTRAFLASDTEIGFLFNVFMIAILPAIGEELLFRGILQKLFFEWTKSAILGIAIASILFSLLHLQFQGFIPRLALGLMFGFLYYWTGSLWIPITTHFANNFIAVVGYTMINKGELAKETENIGGLSQLWPIGVISLVAVLALMWLIQKESTKM